MSNEAKHTPGPFVLKRSAGRYVIETKAKRLDVALIAYRAKVAEEEANGRLFTAAPDLLAALEMAKATIERLEVKHPGGFSSCSGTLDVISAALAKARGEAQ